ncbi:cation:dicarboxylate symporter family transporter, partial [Acinetobacter baumannii]
ARLSLVTRILIAIILGFIVAYLFPNSAQYFIILGELFIKALKSIAPILVFVLVLASIANFKVGEGASNLKPILGLYAIGMLLAAISAITISMMFPSTLIFTHASDAALQPPGSVAEVLKNLLLSFITNPITA